MKVLFAHVLMVSLSHLTSSPVQVPLDETAAAQDLSGAKPGCGTKCGKIIVPYPFGIGNTTCARTTGLYLNCSNSRLYMKFGRGSIEILGLSVSEVRVRNKVASTCYNGPDSPIRAELFSQRYYTFSNMKNKFISVGCNRIAYFQGRSERQSAFCATLCLSKEHFLSGSCKGIGCCQTSIPPQLKFYRVSISHPSGLDANASNITSCSYAFIGEYKEFQFRPLDLFDDNYLSKLNTPVVLDWVVDNVTCKDVQRKSTSYACEMNTTCIDSDNGQGYRCSCKTGYEGNPYLTPGCRDVNECEDPTKNDCIHNGICNNLPGSYNCTCPPGKNGDGRRNSTGCVPNSKAFPALQVALGTGLGLILLLVASSWLYLFLKKRKIARLKEKYFRKNGGLLLQQHQTSSRESGTPNLTCRVYTAQELKQATNNYDEIRILGRGGNGIVYKGIFSTHQSETIVAIKKAKLVDETQIQQFINEVLILTQINHRHVVRLLGCCLETEAPLLVYEFISNGTLHQHIHNRPIGSAKISWQNRLRIATETAGALAYLHSAASIPIFHRDVKSANILLDHNYSTKVADFGASRMIPQDQSQISTLVQGTLGYLDPEYFQTSQLTEKSDVYSFGVILVELLTGQKPLSFEKSEERRNLATYFIISMRGGALLQMTEEGLVDEGDMEQLSALAALALRCLNLKGAERPTMG